MLSYIVKGEMLLVSFLSQKDSDFRFYPKDFLLFFDVVGPICPFYRLPLSCVRQPSGGNDSTRAQYSLTLLQPSQLYL